MLGCKNFALAGLAIGPQRRDLCQISWGFHPYDIAKFHRPLCRDSVVFAFWWARSQGKEEEAYVFNLTLLANQGDSPRQRKRSLLAATCVRYNYYVQLVATKRDWMRVPNLKFQSAHQKGGVKLVVQQAVPVPVACPPPVPTPSSCIYRGPRATFNRQSPLSWSSDRQ